MNCFVIIQGVEGTTLKIPHLLITHVLNVVSTVSTITLICMFWLLLAIAS